MSSTGNSEESGWFILEEIACTCEDAGGATWHYWGAATAGGQPLSPDELAACGSWAELGLSHCSLLMFCFWSEGKLVTHMGAEGRYALSSVQSWQEGGCCRHGVQSNKHMCSYSMPHGQTTLSSVIPIHVPESHYLAGAQTSCILGLGNNETWSQDKIGLWSEEVLMDLPPLAAQC